MGYCNHGHWQHSVSDDLVSWRMVGPPRQFGGTGGMIADGAGRIAVYAATGSARHPKHCPACPQPRDGTEVSCSWKCPAERGCTCKNTGKHADCSAPSDWSCVQESNCRFWTNTSADLSSWVQDNATAFPSSNDTNCDRVWRDGQSWYAFTAGRVGGYGGGGSRGGQENLYANSRPALHGAGADCECGKAQPGLAPVLTPRPWCETGQRVATPFLVNNRSVLVEGHPQRSEFVSACVAQLPTTTTTHPLPASPARPSKHEHQHQHQPEIGAPRLQGLLPQNTRRPHCRARSLPVSHLRWQEYRDRQRVQLRRVGIGQAGGRAGHPVCADAQRRVGLELLLPEQPDCQRT